MNTFSPLFSNLVESSVWDEPYHVRILFVSMLAIKDFDHVVRKNNYQLMKRANVTLQEVEEGLQVLSSPDLKRPGQEFEGRRIERVEDGWLVLNGQNYEDQMRKISRRFYKARKQREYRRVEKLGGSPDGGAAALARAEDRAAQSPEPLPAMPNSELDDLRQEDDA